eukprot:PhM_4_TR231/c0_g1_i1/m.47750
MNERRVGVVKRAFDALDVDGSGVLTIEDLRAKFRANKHPSVVNDGASPDVVLRQMLDRFDTCPDGQVTWEEFIDFYADISESVNKTKEADKDGLFEMMVERSWALLEDRSLLPPDDAVSDTEAPKGIAATEKLDFMWIDPTDGTRLIGYRAVVKPVFARKFIPSWLRSHCLTSAETMKWPHKYLPVQTALLAPYDLVWEVEEGMFEGFRGIIESNVEPHVIPVKLRECIKTSLKSEALGVSYIPQEQNTAHPMYTSNNRKYGTAPTTNPRQTEPGQVWAGRQGNFTNQFTTGPYRNSSLNTSVKRA